MSNTTVNLELQGNVALITLNRPDNANVLNVPLARELLAVANSCRSNSQVRAVILTGAGKHFCFGGDLRDMMSGGDKVDAYLLELTGFINQAVACFVSMDAPVIAAVNGTVAGGGVGLMTMADLALCAESSKVSLAYAGVALTPDCSASFFLPRIVGVRRAAELILTNRLLSAQEALQGGLVHGVVADTDLLAEALKLASRLAAGPRGAFGKTKRLLAAPLSELEAHMQREGATIAGQATSAEGQEGIKAFLEKRKPLFGSTGG